MSMNFTHLTEPTQQHATAWLVMANHLLSLSASGLQETIYQEARENPALEVEERTICPACGRAIREGLCPYCPSSAQATQSDLRAGLENDEVLPSSYQESVSGSEEGQIDPTMLLPGRMTVREELTQALQAELPAEDAPVIEYLVGSLDERGYLICTVEEAAEALRVAPAQVERMLAVLHVQEPGGIGARTVGECLLLQVQQLEAQGQHQPFVHEIIADYLTPLSQGKYCEIARALGTSSQVVEQALQFIKCQLTPSPLQSYSGGQTTLADAPTKTIVPDVIISRRPTAEGDGYTVEVVEAERFCLRVDATYAQVYRNLRRQHAGHRAEEREHIHQYVSRAQLFINSIKQRWQTLHRITCCLVEQQQAFLEQGIQSLQPLTRAEVATALGLHASTVSRATAEKYALLPSAKVVPFSQFFQGNLRIKAILKEVIEERPKPLSDQRLVGLLAERDIHIARRTVAKYREELKVSPRSPRRSKSA